MQQVLTLLCKKCVFLSQEIVAGNLERQVGWKDKDLWWKDYQAYIPIIWTSPLTCSVTLSKSVNLSVPHFTLKGLSDWPLSCKTQNRSWIFKYLNIEKWSRLTLEFKDSLLYHFIVYFVIYFDSVFPILKKN